MGSAILLFIVGMGMEMHDKNNFLMAVVLMVSGLLIGFIELDRKKRGVE